VDKQHAAAFQRLYDRREMAALNCVNAIQFVLAVFPSTGKAQDLERSRQILQNALDEHKQADDAITEFHAQHIQRLKKENSTHASH
jgi:hypothetical protein